MDKLNMIEESIIAFLQGYCSDGVISFLKIMADFGDEVAMIAIIGFLYWCYDKKIGMKLIIFLSTANVFYPMLKNVVKRTRPYMNNEAVTCFKPAYDGDMYDISVQGYSFPSGHMVNCACVYGTLFQKYKKTILRIILALIIVLVGLSRICLGVHYITDVVVGLIFGIVACCLFEKALNKFDKKIVYLALTILGAFGFLFCKSNDFYMGYGMMLGSFASDLFEEKYVRFETTTNILEIIIRMIGGVLVFALISKGCKLPFSAQFLDSKTFLAYLVRAIRYFLIVFGVIGVYPLCFKYLHFGKKEQ